MRSSSAISLTQIVSIKGKFAADQLPAITARVAREKLAEVLASAPAPYSTFVDGAPGVPLESVKPGGKIEFIFNRHGVALDWIYARLVNRAPVKTGNYRDHIWLFINGEHVAIAEGGTAIELQPGDEALFSDAAPYSRKIEKGLSVQAPSGVFELTAGEAKRQFPFADIVYGYAAVEEVVSAKAGGGHRRVRRLLRHRASANLRFPAITVTVPRDFTGRSTATLTGLSP